MTTTAARHDLDRDARWPRDADAPALIARAVRRARRSGASVLLSLSAPVDLEDPVAVIFASRQDDEPFFCLEQPERDGFALAGLGCVRELRADGEQRHELVAAQWRVLAQDAVHAPADAPPGAGLAAMGGFSFAADGGRSHDWRGFAAGSMIVPELTLARIGGKTWLTVNRSVDPDDTEADALELVRRRLRALRVRPLALLDPAPVGLCEVDSPMAPAHFEEAVRRAVQRVDAGEFQKIVLAREVTVHAPQDHNPAAVFGVLRDAFASSFVYAVGRGEATFIGATPELLVRREGQRASTVALAGSTRRSADPAVDNHLGEQLLRSDKDRFENLIVARRIARVLRPHAVWVTAPDEPSLIKIANIQHLGAPIRAQLRESIDAVTLAGMLHPTPAVGAEPAAALSAIPALEGLDRGWYAGAVGWVDATGDGELCVALRCALLRGRRARCWAGCGIVHDSDPAAELAESEMKLGVMLPVLTA